MSDGFFEKKLKIKVKYRGNWYYAHSIMINEDGLLDIEYCYGVDGCVDHEHITDIIVEDVK